MSSSGLGLSREGLAFSNLPIGTIGLPSHIVMGTFPLKRSPHRGKGFSDFLASITHVDVVKSFFE